MPDPNLVHYLSGPMTGLKDYNYPYFEQVTSRLRHLGLTVISPHEIPEPLKKLEAEKLWRYYMDACMDQMEGCNALIQLRGWPFSRGARAELNKAIELGYQKYFFYQDNPGKLVPLH